MPNDTPETLLEKDQNQTLPNEILEREIEEAIKQVMFSDDAGKISTLDGLESYLRDIFTRVSKDTGLWQRHRIIDLINEHKNKLFAKRAINKSHANQKPLPLILSEDIIATEIARHGNQESKNTLYEELYRKFLEALSNRNSALRKELFLNTLAQIDKLNITFEDINSHIQSKYPGSKGINYFAINRDLNKADLDALITNTLVKAQNRLYPKDRPLTNDDLFKAIIRDDKSMVDEFASSSNDTLSRALDHNKTTPLNYFAFLENYKDYSDILQKNIQGGAAGVDEFIKVSRARIATGLSYSTEDFAGLFGFGYEHLMSIMLKDLTPFNGQDTIAKSFECIKNPEINNLPDGRKLKIIEAPYSTHAAYFIIKYDEHNRPYHLSYCDGNLICDQKFAEVTFNIDPQKLGEIINKHGSLEEYLKHDFQDIYEQPEDLKNKFNHAISNLVECDSNKSPKIIEKSIPSKAQKRGNCAFKSMNIALRAAMRELDPELTFEQDENGKGCGKGYEAFQHYKKGITKGSLTNLLECAEQEGFENKIYHDQVIESLKPAFLQAVRKGDSQLGDRIIEIFNKENVCLNDIKSSKDGSNALFFAVKSQNVAMVNWCYDKGICYEENSNNEYPLYFIKTREIALTLLSKESERLDPQQHQEIQDAIDKNFAPSPPTPSIEEVRASSSLVSQESSRNNHQTVY